MAVHPEVVLTVSHRNGLIEPRYAENGIRTSRPKPILKKSITFQNDSPYFSSLQNVQTQKKLSKSANTSQEENLNSCYDSELGRTNDYFRSALERKLNATLDFDSTQKDNLEYLKYNALSYQQNNNNNVSATSSNSDVSETRSVHQRFMQRQESDQLIAAMATAGRAAFLRKPSRSVGDTTRVDHV